MKPRIDFTYEDSRWLKPVSDDVLVEIEKYFDEHPDYKQKFDTAVVKLRYSGRKRRKFQINTKKTPRSIYNGRILESG